ncbi:MAG: RluA family pseudouridine synthase [Patescibacteria group bacterium]
MDTIQILFEDESLLAINKPAGLLVHELAKRTEKGAENTNSPFAIRHSPTLVDWFNERYPKTKGLAWPDRTRPGIVHRLDRDTSGVMLLAKTPEVLAILQQEFAKRIVRKTYLALVAGSPSWNEKTVIAAVSRGEGTRRQAGYLKLDTQAKDAETEFHVIKRFMSPKSEIRNQKSETTLIEAKPLTGRTHQIRVHLGLEDLPILGDPWYQTKISRRLTDFLEVPRLMLHAQKLAFTHPTNHQEIVLNAPLPADFNLILASLKLK